MKQNVIVSYLRESLDEFRRVTWPTRNQAIRLSAIVLSFVLVAAVFIGILDFAFHLGYAKILLMR
ncbi:MAG: preprotein translocase subunit SecE [Candidatus Gracilibacteria bacterium]|nr:preprotein translocase subunit SecE [Candidatus Gracilibacteria bacterium]